MTDNPNVLVVFTDQWRGDCLSAAGHPVVETPFIDRWASTGRRFTRAYSANPSCIPARASLMTGQSARTHGRVGYQDGVPWDYETTLAGELTRAGYRTHAVGKLHTYPERHDLGFESVELHDGYLHFARRHATDLAEVDDYVPWLRAVTGRDDADYAEHGVDCNSTVARPWDKPEWQHPTNWVTQRAVEFLRTRDRDRPFFLFASYHRPHPPYDPPAWAFQQYLDAPMPDPPVGDWAPEIWGSAGDPADPASPYLELPPRQSRRTRAGYYGHMTHIDHQVNRLLEVLGEEQRDDTVIVFASDHGEMMGDHHLYRKSLPYEGSARIPFVVSGPGVEPGVDDRVVELRDVMPTLLGLAGVEVPPGVEGLDALAGRRRSWLHGEHTVHVPGMGGSVQWLTDGRWKYVWRSEDGREQLFDLATDPDELHDLADGGSPVLAECRAELTARLRDRPEGFVAGDELVPGRPVSPVLPA
ncbi:arylsulfatase [Isoptericola sp. BMS4]|uniref:arylsulfatase n=1 Tax=Isoptericola sp. BMS4 TaxID=2527875 RepID=UPI001424269F|nr:arylsulfatase [Isoptericola sp. BMS4]